MCRYCPSVQFLCQRGRDAIIRKSVDAEREQREAAERVKLKRVNRQLLALNERLLDNEQKISIAGDGNPTALSRERWRLLERIAMYTHWSDGRRGMLSMEQLRDLDRMLPPRSEI